MANSVTAFRGGYNVMGGLLGSTRPGGCAHRSSHQFRVNFDCPPFRVSQPAATPALYDAAGLLYRGQHAIGFGSAIGCGVYILSCLYKSGFTDQKN